VCGAYVFIIFMGARANSDEEAAKGLAEWGTFEGAGKVVSKVAGRLWGRFFGKTPPKEPPRLPPPPRPNPETVARTGAPTETLTNRAGEWPYRNPQEMHSVRPGEPVPVLDPNKGTHLWVVTEDGTVLIAPETQAGFGRVVKHGDLVPGPGGQSRGVARAGGELRPVLDGNGKPTGEWIMDNSSSYTFQRADGIVSPSDSLRASKELLQQAGVDTSHVTLQEYTGKPLSGD
jgi:hypothetical protein